jgi:hypothetical protein
MSQQLTERQEWAKASRYCLVRLEGDHVPLE